MGVISRSIVAGLASQAAYLGLNKRIANSTMEIESIASMPPFGHGPVVTSTSNTTTTTSPSPTETTVDMLGFFGVMPVMSVTASATGSKTPVLEQRTPESAWTIRSGHRPVMHTARPAVKNSTTTASTTSTTSQTLIVGEIPETTGAGVAGTATILQVEKPVATAADYLDVGTGPIQARQFDWGDGGGVDDGTKGCWAQTWGDCWHGCQGEGKCEGSG